MKEKISRLDKKFNNVIKEQREKQYIYKTKEYIKKQGVPIPITPDVLLWCLTKKKDLPLIKPHLTFSEGFITFGGKVKKLGVAIPFEIRLKPVKGENRTITFQVDYLKPLNNRFIKRKLFNQQPVVDYDQDFITIELNEISKIRYVPLGNIKSFQIVDGKLWVKVGV
ncbi:hypothetical protein [Shouchella shacheensis]|uniref:hypothetical protein n=1 Tax=Shouchella shacheensis TaxID=1649580 RepID=UPI00073FBEA8|nr:hypothetical protein [Shouchella shacheensis]